MIDRLASVALAVAYTAAGAAVALAITTDVLVGAVVQDWTRKERENR